MRFVADENVPGLAVEALRQDGHDVTWVRHAAPGSTDTDVLHRAQEEERIIVTLDKDFGELAFRLGQSDVAGIVLFRLQASSGRRIAEVMLAALRERSDWEGHRSWKSTGFE